MSGVYVSVSTQIDYHQALKALEQLIAEREPARFSVWDIQRLEGLVTAVKEKLHEKMTPVERFNKRVSEGFGNLAASGVCVK